MKYMTARVPAARRKGKKDPGASPIESDDSQGTSTPAMPSNTKYTGKYFA